MTAPAGPSLSVSRGVVLQVGALMGPGLLLLPGLAAGKAGPASILAWAGLLIVSALLAIVFAALGVRYPSQAGVGAYCEHGLGVRVGRAVSWWFLAGIVTGGPIVCIIGADYVAALLHLGHAPAAAIAAGLLALVVALTFGGLHVSANVQLGLVGLLILLVGLAVTIGIGHGSDGHWTPFMPHGWSSVGSAASVLMLSFAGWEAIASLTPRFDHPRTQLPRVIATAFTLSSALYLALAVVIIAALGNAANTTTPLEALLRLGIGSAAAPIAAAAAVLLTLANTNAYLTGAAGLARALTPTGTSGPRPRDRLPAWLVVFVAAAGTVMIGLDAASTLSIAALVSVPTTFFLAVYLGCTTSAIRLLRGLTQIAAAAATAAVVAVLCFSGWALLLPPTVALIAATTHQRRPRRRGVPDTRTDAGLTNQLDGMGNERGG